MTPITKPIQPLTGARAAILDAATDLFANRGFGGLHMADVAATVGVSRQTVYNEFGTKQGLVQAVALHTTAEFLDGVAQRLTAAPDVLDGIRDATIFAVAHAEESPLISAMLGGQRAEDLLPFITTRGEPVLNACADVGAAYLTERLPELPAETADRLGEALARLIISHVLLHAGTAEQAADTVLAVAAPALSGYRETRPPHRGDQPTSERRAGHDQQHG